MRFSHPQQVARPGAYIIATVLYLLLTESRLFCRRHGAVSSSLAKALRGAKRLFEMPFVYINARASFTKTGSGQTYMVKVEKREALFPQPLQVARRHTRADAGAIAFIIVFIF